MIVKRFSKGVITLIIGLLLFISSVSAAQVTISDVVLDKDGTGTATLVLDQAPNGLAGFKINLGITDLSVADAITGVSYPSGFSQFDTNHIYLNPSTEQFNNGYVKAVDLAGASFPDGSTNILLATVTLHGLSPGTTTLHGNIGVMTDNHGGNLKLTTTVRDGTITVNGNTAPVTSLVPLQGLATLPSDPDQDGLYEDLNGDGTVTYADTTLYFQNWHWIEANEPVTLFDFDRNRMIDFGDIVLLNERV